MKALLYIILIYFPFFFCTQTANPNNDTLRMEVNGIVTHNARSLANAIITVRQDSAVVDQQMTRRNGRFDIFLKYRYDYMLEVSKEGFITKRIIISTKIPEQTIRDGGTGFYDLNIPMIEMINGLDVSIFNNPVTRFEFDPESFYFNPDKKFEAPLSGKLNKVYSQLELLRKKEYSELISHADQYLQNSSYEEAWAEYNEALGIIPDETYPGEQIKKIRKLIKKETSAEEGYENAVLIADRYFSRDELPEATNYYERALFYRPKEIHPLNRLQEIDSIKGQRFLIKKRSFDSEMAEANACLARSDIEGAMQSIERALSIFPDDQPAKSSLENLKILAAKPEFIKPVLKPDTGGNSAKKQVDNGRPGTVNAPEKDLTSGHADQTTGKEKAKEKRVNAQPVAALKNEVKQQSPERAVRTKPVENNHPGLPSSIADTLRTEDGKKITPILEKAKILEKKGDFNEASSFYNDAGNFYHDNNKLDKALVYYEKAFQLKQKTGDKEGATVVLNDIAVAYYDSGKYETAVAQYKKALELSEELGNRRIEAIVLDNIGQIYENTYRYDQAIDYYEQSLNVAKGAENKTDEAMLQEKIANVFLEQNKFDKALEYFLKTLKTDEDINDESRISSTLNHIGIAYHTLGNYNGAMAYYERSLNVTDRLHDKMQTSIVLNNIGNVNYDWQKFSKAIEYYEKSVEIKEDIDYSMGLAVSLYNIGNAYKGLKEYPKALEYYKRSNAIAEKIDFQEATARNYRAFAELYSLLKDYKSAFEYQKLYAASKVTGKDESSQMFEGISREYSAGERHLISSLRRQIQKQKLLAEYEANDRMKEIEIKNLEIDRQNERLKRLQLMVITFISGTVLIVLFLILVFRQYRHKKKANIELIEKNKLISFQKQQITDSIRYASRIQKAVLPPREIITQILPRHFILNKPRDIVSGDYYWTTQRGKESIIAVADCTGHGVPGAFMSMLGISYLNEIVNKKTKASTHEILDQLRGHVMSSLHQTGKDDETKDGMDIALCIINLEKMELQFSGAHNPLFLIRGNELTEIKADKMPIGISIRYNQPFRRNDISLKSGDMLYIFTDGYYDQFGGVSKKKFGIRRFKELLLDIHHKEMEEQQQILESTFAAWKDNYGQLDDVLIMGLHIE